MSGPSVVQHISAASGAAATSASVTLTPSAGNTVVLCIADSGVAVSGVSDNAGNAWTKVDALALSGTGAELWYAYGVAAMATTITAASATTQAWVLDAIELGGLLAGNPIDDYTGATGNTSAPSSGTTTTTTQASEIAIGMIADASATTSALSAGYTALASNAASSGTVRTLTTAYKVLTATGVQSFGATLSATNDWAVILTTFLATPGAMGGAASSASTDSGALSGAISLGGAASSASTETATLSASGASVPSITSWSPVSGTAGTVISVTGTNFGTTQGSSYVQFIDGGTSWGAPGNAAAWSIDSWSDTLISFSVPSPSGTDGTWAVIPGTTATFTVTTSGGTTAPGGTVSIPTAWTGALASTSGSTASLSAGPPDPTLTLLAQPQSYVPHLAIPFVLAADGTVATVEQDSEIEIAQCVGVLASTVVGSRIEVPPYGVPDPTFTATAATAGLARAIPVWEPRAAGAAITLRLSDDGNAVVTVGLPSVGGAP